MLHSVKSRVCTCTDNKLAQKPEKLKKNMSLAHTQAPTGSLCHSLLWLSIFTLYTVQYTVLARLKTLSLGSQRRRHDDAFSPGLHHCRLYRLWQISPLHIDHCTLIIVKKELTWGEVRSRGPSWQLVRYCLSQRAGLFSFLFLSWSPALLDLPCRLWSI